VKKKRGERRISPSKRKETMTTIDETNPTKQGMERKESGTWKTSLVILILASAALIPSLYKNN